MEAEASMSSQQAFVPGEPGPSRTSGSASGPSIYGPSPLESAQTTSEDNQSASSSSGAQARSGSGLGPQSTYASQQQQQQQQHIKRTRVLLSCAPCRTSKLKCDRGQPCSMCVRKGRTDGCLYAPRPEKARPAKSMAARLKRLEGMVRGMMPGEGGEANVPAEPVSAESGDFSQGRGQVVVASGGKSTTYVGATHFMAMLDDIEDLKSYFEEDDTPSDGASEPDMDGQSSEVLMVNSSAPRSRRELLNHLPPRHIVDRLVMRFFSAYSPSQHIIHRPTFVKQYAEFWQDQSQMPLDWVALLFNILALGTFFSTYTAPHELELDSDMPPMHRFSQYRTAAGWALISAKYTHPGPMTLQPMVLYIEAEFLVNRASQMNCYLLCAVGIRLMMKMGLHRDPSKLPNISPFDGEMRRRMWNLLVQIDLIVSFHLGLPSMIHGIESDTNLPRNLINEDLREDMTELPPSRPDSEYTELTYPIWKSTICRVFGLVARQAHSLTLPTYSDVMRLDSLLEEKWRQVPSFIKVKPLEDSITDPPQLVNQRFGLAALYQKSRCVLHRRYLIEAIPRKEHEYSRKTCLDAALSLLDYQNTIYQATLPGGLLRQNGWFITSLAIHDFLLAAMVIYLVIQTGRYPATTPEFDPMSQDEAAPSRNELINLLRRSHRIWIAVSSDAAVAKKACNILATMLRKITDRGGEAEGDMEQGAFDSDILQGHMRQGRPTPGFGQVSQSSMSQRPSLEPYTAATQQTGPQTPFSRTDFVPAADTPWLSLGPNAMDWSSFDQALRGEEETADPLLTDDWLQQRTVLDDLDFASSGFWGPPSAPSSGTGPSRQ
ncbi:hypothetical protein BR93DRAFT_496754 [Coniochaeta sp. PMI_546]|nr:hypothetical protein BR93DRAFT_496754 [Coniochaeta sp. PMI_546]